MRLLTIMSMPLVFGLPSVTHAQGNEPGFSLFERDTLTGDWGGLRSTFAGYGIDIGLANYGDTIGIPSGGSRHRTTYSHLLQPEVTVDLETLVGWRNGNLFFLGIGTYGADPIESTGSISNPSNLAAPDAFRVLEAWVEQRFFEDKLTLLVGIYAVDAEFDVKETADVFLNSGFGTGLDLSETGLNGPCIFPFSCLGVRLRVQPTESYYFQAALTDGVAGDPDDPQGTKIKLDDGDGVLFIAEIGYQKGSESESFFRLGIGGWLYTTDFDDVLDEDADGNPIKRDGTHGVYGFMEGDIFSEADAPAEGLSGFIRVGGADENVNQIAYYVGGGLVYSGLIPGRNNDVAGFGVSAGINGDRFEKAQRRAGESVDDLEVAFEWTYRMQLSPWWSLQPDIQYIINPGTDPDVDDALAIGFRYEVVF